MRRLTLFALSLSLISACNNQDPASTTQTPEQGISADIVSNPISLQSSDTSTRYARLTFVGDTLKNFGDVKEGQKLVHDFEFVNDGNVDLLIQEAKGSCGCTVPSYPKEPIKPGQKQVITVTFDTKGRFGINDKSVVIVTNGVPSVRECFIQANVLRTSL